MEIYWTILKNNLKKAIERRRWRHIVWHVRENLLRMTQHAEEKCLLMTHFHDLLLLLLLAQTLRSKILSKIMSALDGVLVET